LLMILVVVGGFWFILGPVISFVVHLIAGVPIG